MFSGSTEFSGQLKFQTMKFYNYICILFWISWNICAQAAILGLPLCNQGPLACLLQFHKVIKFRFHFDFIRGVDRYVTGRDAIIENKEIEQYVEEIADAQEQLEQEIELLETHTDYMTEEEKYRERILEFWRQVHNDSLTNNHRDWIQNYTKNKV